MREHTGEDLLERDAELDEADRLLAEARAGSGAVLLIEGPAGIGKSALLRAVRARAQAEGVRALTARGAELEREFSFGVVRQLFEPTLAGAGPAQRAIFLAGAAELAEPAVGGLDAAAAAVAGSPTVDPSFAVLHGLYWLTVNLAEQSPLLLAVDDAHWSDAASLRFLSYLAGRLEEIPVLLIAGVRPFEPGAAAELLSALDAEAVTRTLRLAPLSETASSALIRARLAVEPGSGFVEAAHRAAGGNPQLIRELLAALAAEGVEPTAEGAAHVAELRADRIAASVLARLARLGDAALRLARATAVLGASTPGMAAELAELRADEAARVAESLRTLEILEPGTHLAFVHPIVRTAVYNDFAPSARGDMHRRAAHLLAAAGGDPQIVAAQLVAARPTGDEWTVAQLRSAAEDALARGAPDAAVTYLERALEEPPPDDAHAEVLVGLGRGFAMLRDGRNCIRTLTQALELTDEPRRRGEIGRILITMLGISRAAARAVKILDRELAGLPDSERDLGLRMESDIDAMSFFSLSAKQATDGRRRRFDDPADPSLVASAAMLASLYEGPAERAIELANRAWAGGALLQREGPDAPAVWMVACAFLYAHALERCVAVTQEWSREASRRGSLRAFSIAASIRTRAAYWRGDLAEAEADARAFLQGMPEAIGFGPANLADALMEQGRLDEAERALGLAERARVEVEWSFYYPMLLASRGRLAAQLGRPEDARGHLLESGRVAEEWGVDTPGPWQWRLDLAEVLLMFGATPEARELIEAELVRARAFGSARALGIALRVAGLADPAERVERLTEAAGVLAPSEARLEHARALVDLGAALRRAKRSSDAREPLRDGLALARACGARSLAERAHDELTATGARPRKIVRAGVDALTASERRVARMAADGMANKEIAQALFVTVRTVEAHLHHAYQKLEISSRGELARALDDARD